MVKPKGKVTIVSDPVNQEPLAPPPSPKISPETNKNSSQEPVSPNPFDFDAFVPWACLQWQVHDPVVVKITHGTYKDESPKARKGKAGKAKSSRTAKSAVSTEDPISPVKVAEPVKTSSQKFEDTLSVPVTAYYDDITGHLVWISISNYRLKINKNVIQAISICAPFHPFLSKFTFTNCTLTGSLLHRISMLLFDSNITEICLDGTFFPEANYHVLLSEISQLRYLSLNKCGINDIVCTKIVQRIGFGYPASTRLQILDFGSNYITDIGAQAIGQVLRSNRNLLHINLAGNKITDVGLTSIVHALKEFPLSHDEIMVTKKEKMRFMRNKNAVYRRCLSEVLNKATVSDELTPLSKEKTRFIRNKNAVYRRCLSEMLNGAAATDVLSPNTIKSLPNTSLVSKKQRFKGTTQCLDVRKPEVIAEMMANRIVGEFKGAYGPQDVVIRDGYYYAKGNFTLCSINLAYNDLDYFSVKKICGMLAYQSEKVLPPSTGIMRVVLNGNNIPDCCPELDSIGFYLKEVIADNSQPITSSVSKKRMSSSKMKSSSTPRIK